MKDTSLKQLINLHSIDRQLNLLNEQRGELPVVINNASIALEKLQEEVKESNVIKTKVEKSKKEFTIKLEDNTAKIDKINEQIFKVKTNKEYDALLNEIDFFKKENSTLKEEIDGLDSTISKNIKLLNTSDEKIEELTDKISVNSNKLKDIDLLIKKDENKLIKEKEKCIKGIQENDLLLYNSKKDEFGLAFGEVSRNACMNCYTSLPSQLIIDVADLKDFESCPSCNILLYIEDLEN